MPEPGRLSHAKHNAEICRSLTNTKFNDWKVTTAFYAALHYVRHKIFPIKEKTKDGKKFEVKSFNDYQKAFNPKQLGKHELLSKLVSAHCPDISKEYSWLFNTCITCRYHNYQVSSKVANRADDALNKIEQHCNI